MSLTEAASDFLAQRRIAVAGVSRSRGQAANTIYKKLRTAGYDVVPINPHADEVEGDHCYPNLTAVAGGVDAVVIATHPEVTPRVARECVALGIGRVWIHRGLGTGSVSEEAIHVCEDAGIPVIPGGCPLMFLGSRNLSHACLGWILGHTGRLPDVESAAPLPAPPRPSERPDTSSPPPLRSPA